MQANESSKVDFDVHQSIEDIIGVENRITVESLRAGLPIQSVGRLGAYLDLTQPQILRLLAMGKRSYASREASGLLTVDESDRVVRFAGLLVLAIRMFEDSHAAARWLNTPAPSLGDETPLAHATTGMGSRIVEQLIGRLEHGIPT